MAIHTKTLVAGVDDYFEGIIDFFEDYYDSIIVEVDEEDDTTLYFKEDENTVRAKAVNTDGQIQFTIYGSSEEVYRTSTMQYGSGGTARNLYLTATSKAISISVHTSGGKDIGELVFGESRNEVPFVVLAYSALTSGLRPSYYTATGNDNEISLLSTLDLKNNINYTWLINVPTGMEDSMVDYANGVTIPLNYQIIGNTFPYIFRTNLMVNTIYFTLDDGQYMG